MDDKDSKNIDGIKVPEEAAQDSEKIAVTVNKTNTEGQPTDVSITSDGTIDEQSPAEPVSELNNDVPVQAEQPLENSTPDSVVSEDPGIVPSVQPTVAPATVSPATEVARLKERNKHLKIWLVVLMLLLVAVTSALVVYFAQQAKAKNDLTAQQQANSELQAQLNEQQQTATQETIDDLNASLEAEKTKNADLQKTIDEQAAQIVSYQNAVKELLKVCGTTCSSVDVPEDESNNNTTN